MPCLHEHDSTGRLIHVRVDPLLMNAFNTINLAGACVLTSTEYATELGIPESKWIYALGGAGTADERDCERSTEVNLMYHHL